MRWILFFLFSLLLTFNTGCGGDYIVYHAPSLEESQQIHWHEYSNTLLLTSTITKKPALIYFTADWCEVCRKFEKETLLDHRIVYSINQNFVPLIIKDDHKDFRTVAMMAGVGAVDGVMVPSISVLSSQNIPEHLLVVEGYAQADVLLLGLSSASTLNALLIAQNELDVLLEVF